MKIYYAPDEYGSGGSLDSQNGAPSPQGATDPQGSTADGEQGGSESPVPYDRFQEVSHDNRSLRDQMNSMQGQLDTALQHNQQWQDQAKQQQQRQQQAQQRRRKPTKQQTDAGRDYLRSLFGPGEQGDQAFEALEKYYAAKHRQTSQGQQKNLSPQQIQAMINQGVQGGMNQINSTFQTANRFQGWVDRGMATSQEAQGMQAQLNEILGKNPDLAKNSNGLAQTVNGIYMMNLESGTIRPTMDPPETPNPLQPSVGGQPEAEIAYDPSQSRMSRLKNLDAAKLKQLAQHSMDVHEKATS